MQHHVPTLFANIPEETLRFKNIYIFCCGNQSSYCRKENILLLLQLEQNVFCISITDLRSPASKVAELIHFPHTPNDDSYRWKQIVLWAHKTTPTGKSEAATF
jgi:hypothetical protein